MLRGGAEAMRQAAVCSPLTAPRRNTGQLTGAFPHFGECRTQTRYPDPVHLFRAAICQFFLPTIRATIILQFGSCVSSARRPATSFAHKAGDCFGFGSSFTEWLLVLADRGRF